MISVGLFIVAVSVGSSLSLVCDFRGLTTGESVSASSGFLKEPSLVPVGFLLS